jgi:hypothetical protein
VSVTTTPWLTFYLPPRESHVENLVQISPNLAKSPPTRSPLFSVVDIGASYSSVTGAELSLMLSPMVAYYYNLSALFVGCLRRDLSVSVRA